MRAQTVRGAPAAKSFPAVIAVAAALSVMITGCTETKSSQPARSSSHENTSPNNAKAILIGHAGRWLTNGDGQVVILHGLNMVNKQLPYEPAAVGFASAAASTLADNGLDVVRLGVVYTAVEPEPGAFSGAYLNSIAGTVAQLARRGLYSLLDFHQDQMSVGFGGEGFPEWSVDTGGLPERRYVFPLGYTASSALAAAYDNFWANRPGPGGIGLQQRYSAAWQYVARRFANDAWVIGYDLFNEPWPAHSSDSELGAFYKSVIEAIRSVDRVHLIFYEPYVLFDFGTPTSLPALGDSDLGMSFHDYCLQSASAHAAACGAGEEHVLANALSRSRSTGDALVLSEFGATSDLSYLGRLVAEADSNQMSWIEWAYCGCGDPTGTIPPSIEGLVSDPRLPGTGSNVDTAKLAVLAEPYPRVTSGTPASYSFDPRSHTFVLHFTTRSPTGKVFAPGSCTALVVPPIQFPHGYVVTVTGGLVTSSQNAGVLTVSQSGGAVHTVTVVLRPGSDGATTIPDPAALTACT